jgi:hypothetical protein
MSDGPNDFSIANQISDLLKDLPSERQQRIVRWVTESIGVVVPPTVGPAPLPDPGSGPIPRPPGHTTNIKSFVESKSPKSDMQFAAVVAYFHRFEAPIDQRLDSISAETLQDAARLANRPRLASPATTLRNAKAQGYLDTESRGQYRINSVGENLVAMALPGTAAGAPSTRPRAKTKKSGRKAATPKAVGQGRQKKVKTARR